MADVAAAFGRAAERLEQDLQRHLQRAQRHKRNRGGSTAVQAAADARRDVKRKARDSEGGGAPAAATAAADVPIGHGGGGHGGREGRLVNMLDVLLSAGGGGAADAADAADAGGPSRVLAAGAPGARRSTSPPQQGQENAFEVKDTPAVNGQQQHNGGAASGGGGQNALAQALGAGPDAFDGGEDDYGGDVDGWEQLKRRRSSSTSGDGGGRVRDDDAAWEDSWMPLEHVLDVRAALARAV